MVSCVKGFAITGVVHLHKESMFFVLVVSIFCVYTLKSSILVL